MNYKFPLGAITKRTIVSKLPGTKFLWLFPTGEVVVEMPQGSYLCKKCCHLAGEKGKLRRLSFTNTCFDFGNLVKQEDLIPISTRQLVTKDGNLRLIQCFFHGTLAKFPKNISELVANHKIDIQKEKDKQTEALKDKIKELERLARKGDLIAYGEWKKLTGN